MSQTDCNVPSPGSASSLNPDASVFMRMDKGLVHRGKLYPDLQEDWEHVQQVQAGGVGDLSVGSDHLWKLSGKVCLEQFREAPMGRLGSQLLYQHGMAPKQIFKVNSLSDVHVKMPEGIARTILYSENK